MISKLLFFNNRSNPKEKSYNFYPTNRPRHTEFPKNFKPANIFYY